MFSKYLFLLLLALLSVSNGKAQVPALVADVIPGTGSSLPIVSTVFNGNLYFVAGTAATGDELWKYDGILPPTLVCDLWPGPVDGISLGFSTAMLVFNNHLYFTGRKAGGTYELYRYDGINPPTPVNAFNVSFGSSGLLPEVVFNNQLVCTRRTPSAGRELYIYDGVNAPVLYDINPGSGDSYPTQFIAYNGKLYFSTQNATSGYEFFVFDPIANTISLVADINPGPSGSYPSYPQLLGNKIYFTATTATYGYELYEYDGTTVTRLTDLNPGSGDGVRHLKAFDNKIYLSGATAVGGSQLYSFDPSNGTTSLVHTLDTAGNSSPYFVSVYHNKLYLLATSAATGYELWETDGVITRMLPEIDAGPRRSYYEYMLNFKEFNNSLYFCGGDSATTGYELYQFTTPIGVQPVSFNDGVAVYPNPTTDGAQLELNLASARTINIVLLDAAGRKVYSPAPVACPSGKVVLPLPLHLLSAGVYFYSLHDAEGSLLQSGQITKK